MFTVQTNNMQNDLQITLNSFGGDRFEVCTQLEDFTLIKDTWTKIPEYKVFIDGRFMASGTYEFIESFCMQNQLV